MHLDRLGISALRVTPDPVCIATEGALWGSIQAHGLLRETVIVSDDAGQFDVGQHALCWVHAERLVHKLDTFTDLHRAAQERMRALIWWFYADLKAYRVEPTARRRGELRARFDRIFRRRTGFVTLDRLLERLHANKPELLMVLDRPEIPLHTNGSERDIRCHVTKRKISGGTHSSDWPRLSRRLPRLDAHLQPNSASHFGIISATVSASRISRSFHTCQTSSAVAASPPDHHRHGFCPGYEKSALQWVAGNCEGCDPRWWLWRQLELELLDQEPEFRFRLGVTGHQHLSPVGCRQMNIDHLDGGKLLESAPCGQSWCQGMQATLQRDLQTIGQERNENMGFDPVLLLMEDWPDRQIAFQVLERLLDTPYKMPLII